MYDYAFRLRFSLPTATGKWGSRRRSGTEEEDDLDQELPAAPPPRQQANKVVKAREKRKRAWRSRARFWHLCEGGLGSLADLV
jgi:hypothetical protein